MMSLFIVLLFLYAVASEIRIYFLRKEIRGMHNESYVNFRGQSVFLNNLNKRTDNLERSVRSINQRLKGQ